MFEETKVRSIEEFDSSLDCYLQSGKSFLYRGMTNACWDVISSADLNIYPDVCEPHDKKDIKMNSLMVFKGMMNYVMEHEKEKDPDNMTYSTILGMLQHLGVPTPMIDFSYCPYTALWFACTNQDNEFDDMADGVVYGINHNDENLFCILDGNTKKVVSPIKREDRFVVIKNDEHALPRIAVQKSVFLFSSRVFNKDEHCALRIMIDKEFKRHIVEQLMKRKISALDLFPDAKGLEQYKEHKNATLAFCYRMFGNISKYNGFDEQAKKNYKKAEEYRNATR